ncbi:DUF2505 domain-containing protein [Paraliomyxa miuraensis]|uniref:DUF2505 domain-containing protein n=1 Tax=Paraliomyxa miuraensis TaxID=376150 RepID=UPI002250C0B8|nr:DUF2505 domain-containing protein [Paraliomyxa miuraensis]MCX4247505.1 DUF2505 domain-containing protein [Paraliomyxa miuraensis]
MEYRIEDDFDVSAERYWEIFFSDDYNEGLWPALDIKRELLKFDRQGEGAALRIHREQRLTPQREVPAFVKKLVSGAITYVEKNEFVAADSVMKTITIPGFAADRITTTGTYRLVPKGPGRCSRVWEGVCECRIPLLGGKVEKHLIDEVRESYRRATVFTRTWIAEHPA